MANPHLGDVEFDVAGKPYTLRFSVDAMCQVEEKAGKGFHLVAAELNDIETTTVRMQRIMLWAALQHHHKGITLIEAGELIVSGGGALAVLEKVGKAIELAFPQQSQSGETSESPPATPSQ